MSDSAGSLFGRLCIERGFATQEQIDVCLRVQAHLGGRHHLGALLVNRGYITEEQLRELLSLQQALKAQQPAPAPAASAAVHRVAPQPALHAPAHVAAPAPRAAPARPSPSAGEPVDEAPPHLAAPLHATSVEAVTKAHPGTSRIPHFLEKAEKRGASDVHFHPATPATLRVGGRLLVSSQPPLEARELAPQLLALLDSGQRAQLEKEQSLDALVVTPTGLRCRASLYFTHTGLNGTFRLVRRAPPTLAELGLPTQLASFISYSQGLVLVTGLAGSGKTSTLAALVNLIAEERSDHVLCLEDPIEIIHPVKKALVNQRQVGRDTESFARALRGALREDPDVIVLGELRDSETISLAVTAAEMGHLVLGSMNTATAARAISRILGAFPPAQQQQVRAMVSESLHGVVTQRLVPTVDGGRAAALEILVVTPAIANLIRDDKMFQVRSAMQTGRSQGMRTMDDSLRELVQAGRVLPEEARRYAETPALFASAPPPIVTPPPGSLTPVPAAAARSGAASPALTPRPPTRGGS